MSYLDNYAANVANIYAQRAQGLSQAELQKGAAWANAFQNVGQIAQQVPGQMQQQQVNAQQAQLRQAQLDEAARADAEAKRGQDERDALDKAWEGAANPDGSINIDAVLNATPGHLRKTTQDTLTAYQKSINEAATAKAQQQKLDDEHALATRNAIGALALGVKAHGYDPAAFTFAVSRAMKDGLVDKPTAQQLIQNLTPDKLPKTLDELIRQSPEASKLETERMSAGKPMDIGGVPFDPVTRTFLEPPVKPEPHSPAYREWQDAVSQGYKGDFNAYQTEDANRKRPVTSIITPSEPPPPADPASQDILSQTGLSLNAFRSLTGQTSQLPRDMNTRNLAAKEAQEFARKHGVDVSTLAAQYKTYNDVLGSNISRLNNTKIMEQELVGTIQNLQDVVKDQDLGKLKFANVAKVWAGQEVNDELAQQYALHLSQLRNELTAYFGATQGRTGNNLTVEDKREAEQVIKNGIAQGSLNGLLKAVENSTGKMGTVMQGSVDRSQKAVWSLFGVGQNYQNKGVGNGGDLVATPPPDQSGNWKWDAGKKAWVKK